jgi:hypothetical protein
MCQGCCLGKTFQHLHIIYVRCHVTRIPIIPDPYIPSFTLIGVDEGLQSKFLASLIVTTTVSPTTSAKDLSSVERAKAVS